MIDDIKVNALDYMKDNHKFIICLLIVLAVLGIGYYEYKQYKPVPMASVSKINTDEITKALSGLYIQATPHETKDIVQTIERRVQSPPDIVYVTTSQVQADQQANKLAKDDKTDVIIKETKPPDKSVANEPIVNKYYGIHVEKENKIKVGITVVDSKVYENIGYQHKKMEVIIHMRPGPQSVKGATVMQTIAEW